MERTDVFETLEEILRQGGDSAASGFPPGVAVPAAEPAETEVDDCESIEQVEAENIGEKAKAANTDEAANSEAAADAKPASPMMRDLMDDERPREKALKQGFNSLTDVELLALLLGSGIRGKSVLEFAREILKDNDNRLAYLSRKSIPELIRRYKGMGVAKATLLVAAMTFGARTQADLTIADPQLSSSDAVYNHMRSRLERLNNEEFWVLHLSRANRLISAEQISKGGQHQTSVDAKLIAKSCIDRLSSSVILVHNHPSGNMNPSGADDQLTRKITEVCRIVDVGVLDHVIIGPTGYYSYRDQGRM